MAVADLRRRIINHMRRSAGTSSTESSAPDARLWRPFLRLGKILTKDFLQRAEHWMFLVSAYGISKTPAEPTTEEEWYAFFAQCHDGWKQAQTEIAAFLIDALAKRTHAREDEKKQHRLKNKEGQKQAKARSREVELEIAVARRMLDVILWTIVAGDHSTLRRLHVRDGQHSLSATNIEDAMRAAASFNSDPMVMALSTDMLSFVHVGDLLVANRKTGTIDFVELKAGNKNAHIAAVADFAVRSECVAFERMTTANFNETDKKHYERVKRQAERNNTIVSTIRNEGGTDPSTGLKVVIRAMPEPVDFWSDRIEACYAALRGDKTWALDVIDECVYLGVYSDQMSAFAGFNGWMKIQHCESKIFSLTDSFHDPGVRPLGATFLSMDLRLKVLRGEILVIICLDILKFIELGNSMQPGYMQLASKAASLKAHSRLINPLTLNGRHIVTTIGGETAVVGLGTRDRILFDQQSPRQLLAHRLAAGPIGQSARSKAK
jgi:hypothetical protein